MVINFVWPIYISYTHGIRTNILLSITESAKHPKGMLVPSGISRWVGFWQCFDNSLRALTLERVCGGIIEYLTICSSTTNLNVSLNLRKEVFT